MGSIVSTLVDLVGWEAIIVTIIAGIVYVKFIKQKEPEFVIDRKIRVIENLSSKVKKGSVTTGVDGPKMTILYYSQTGTAEDFATRLGEDIESTGIPVVVCDVEDYDTDLLVTETCVVVFAATYGEGDPPDNSQDFHSWFLDPEREDEDYSNVNFSVFGLGNSTYEHYNKLGKQVNQRFNELMCTPFYNYGEGDDDKNLENDFLVWKQSFKSAASVLFPDVDMEKKAVEIKAKQKVLFLDEDDVELRDIDLSNTRIWRFDGNDTPNRIVDAQRPFMAKMVINRELHSESSDRSCRHIEFSSHDGLLRYESGDHIGVYPENDLTLVHKLCSLLKQNPEEIIKVIPIKGGKPIVGPCTLKAALIQFYDITNLVRKPMLRILAHYASDPEEQKKLNILGDDNPDNQELYTKEIVQSERNVVEVLKMFKSSQPPLAHFLENLPRLQPRFYSISSSSQKDPDTVHVTAVVVDWVTPTRRHAKGVATNWFAEHLPTEDLNEVPRMPVFIRPNHHFKLPKNSSTPIIMVGPGTGLAPFRGFIQDRAIEKEKNGSIGETLFFFGCRHPDQDYLYEDELKKYHEDGVIELHSAFSRLTEEKVYVQHLMLQDEMAPRIWELLEAGAIFYLCGDSNRLVKDLQNAIVQICMKYGGKSEEEGQQYLKEMMGERYFADVW